MSELSLAFCYLRARPLTAALHMVLLALGVATIVVVVLLGGQVENRMLREVKGIDLVIGAKGSPLQLILSAVFQADVPTGNISLGDTTEIMEHPMVIAAVPLALGDSIRGFHIVGTEPSYLDLTGTAVAEGRLWQAPYEAVLGAAVARKTGLRLGEGFVSTHGLAELGPAHAEHPYTVVGILPATGRVLDRIVLTSLESVWEIHEPKLNRSGPLRALTQAAEEITAIVVRYSSPLAAVQLPRFVNSQTALQAASPALEVARLQELLGFGARALQVTGLVLCLAASLGIGTALMTALDARSDDLALMRAIGGSPGRLARIVLIEALVIALVGLSVGLVIGHGVIELIGRNVADVAFAGLSGYVFDRREWALIAAVPLLAAAAALLPAIRAFRTDVAALLARRP